MNSFLRIIFSGGHLSRNVYWILLACFALNLTAVVQAQPAPVPNRAPVDVSAEPDGYLSLNSGWRTMVGDDPAFAQPGYDDSRWPGVTLGDSNLNGQGFRWYRIRLKLPASHPPMALALSTEEGAFEVFADGKPIGNYRIGPNLQVHHERPILIPLPEQVPSQGFDRLQVVTIAVRTMVYPYDAPFGVSRTFPSASVGPLPTITLLISSSLSTAALRFVSSYAIDLAVCLAGLGVLGLFFAQRSNREYLWLSLYLFLLGLSDLLVMLTFARLVAYSWNVLLGTPLLYVLFIPQIEFTFAFVRRRVGIVWRSYEAILLACALITRLIGWYDIFPQLYLPIEIVVQIPAFLGLPVALVLWFRRGNREAGWLILPSLLPGITVALYNFLTIQQFLGSHRFDALQSLLEFSIGPFPVRTQAITSLLFLLAIGIVLFFRFTRVSRMQARSAAELEAASEMQRRLIPQQLPRVQGCEIHAAYMPAAEVGGDFFQVLPEPHGGALLVVGDVSGKGLKAAMSGALAIGALRTLARENLSPAAILLRLNEEIVEAQQDGFITCLCVRIGATGNITMANAGHLAPYLNGVELPVEPSLPLGLVSSAVYSELKLQLDGKSQLTLLTDGVVEAIHPASKELFGFERTAAISTQSAEVIAHAAQAFGQEDDITVLTLNFAGSEVMLA